MTSQVGRNFLANTAGKVWSALLSLAVVPLQIHFLGIEAYGLIGVFLTLAGILSLLDLGLGNALNRELARCSLDASKATEMHDLVRTLEIIYWGIGLATGLIVAGMASFLSTEWVQAKQMETGEIGTAVMLMGIVLACQWPRALYYAGLMGLQQQVVLNVLSAVMATLLNIGGILILWLVAPSIKALLIWQILMGLTETLASRQLLARGLPASDASPHYSAALLSRVWKFAAGMAGVSITSVMLTQLDKVVLSKVLALETFGYYSLAWRLASGLYYLIGPVTTAFFPRFAQLALSDERNELSALYHKGCQLMAVLVLPTTAILALFAEEIISLWTGNLLLAANSAAILAILCCGTALNGIMGLPAALQFAHGWTRMVLTFNTLAIAVLGPATFVMAQRYGGAGAASVWLALNIAYVSLMMRLMHKRILPGELAQWYAVDLGLPLVATLAVALACKYLLFQPYGPLGTLLEIMAASVLAFLAAVIAAPRIRDMAWGKIRTIKNISST